MASAREALPPTTPQQRYRSKGQVDHGQGVKTKGKKLKLARTDKIKAMEADVKSLNKFLAGFELEGGSFSGYRRLFQ